MTRIQCMAVASVFMVALAAVKANQCSSGGECPSGGDPSNDVSMLQTKLQMNALEHEGDEEMAAARKVAQRGVAVEGALVKAASGNEACTTLLNKYTHFAVEVAVGTPAQKFELVIDTGSDAVIVTSCICVEQGLCAGQTSCFRGHNKSSTFDIPEEGATELSMSFGSGDLMAVVATDIVEVGGLTATMEDGLLLMLDRTHLNVSGPFDGILGLGPPKIATQQPGYLQVTDPTDDYMQYQTKRFLKEAGVDRFTICFNDGPGVLRMNVAEFEKTLPAIGTEHWALGLHGVSVGSEAAPALFCNPSAVSDGQTPCGAIPDSGTTLLTAPQDQVLQLFASLCEDWERCREARTGTLQDVTAANAFQLLVRECNVWMTDENGGINEIPSIFLTLGSSSDPQKIEMTPWAYIDEIEEEEWASQIKWTKIPVTEEVATLSKRVCVPRIGGDDFFTNQNGPVWLLGTPLFHQFTVGYDLQLPGIAFKNETCEACTAPASFIDGHKQLSQRVRRATEPPRVRKIDKSLPL